MINKEHLVNDLNTVRQKSPLVHNITNYVAMNFSANALLAIGASPVMAHAAEEMEEMTAIADALVINIGTLDSQWVDGMLKAGNAMRKRSGVIVLDPVGAGATTFRTDTAWRIIDTCHPDVIRGNASEIGALTNSNVRSRGVDSTETSNGALESARLLARLSNSVVTITGPTDYITDGERVETVSNGSPMMTRVTAMGCTASSMVGAFASVNKNIFEAVVHAMAVMGVAGELAAEKSAGSGSMQANFIDELYLLTPDILLKTLRQ